MKTRGTVSLHPLLDNELNNYVAAAKANATTSLAAAAISAISIANLSAQAHAEIVYTPANESIGVSCFECFNFSTLQIDLNNDGVPDIVVSAYNKENFSEYIGIAHDLSAGGLQGNQILGTSQGLAAAGVLGQVMGAQGANFVNHGIMATSFYFFATTSQGGRHSSGRKGLWFNATNRYLGVKFSINGETHYGWARFNAGPGSATLTGYAYETIPDKPMPAGVFETTLSEEGANAGDAGKASLGVLARGATKRDGVEIR